MIIMNLKMKSLIVSICLILSLNEIQYSNCALNKLIKSWNISELLAEMKDIKVYEVKMSQEMAFEVISHSVDQLNKFNLTVDTAMAKNISQHLAGVYNGSWLVTISVGNITSSSSRIHKDPYIKFAFKLDTFEIEKEITNNGSSICGKTQKELLREAAGKPVIIAEKNGSIREKDVEIVQNKISEILALKNTRNFTILSEELQKLWRREDDWHNSVDVGVNNFYESYTDLYTDFKPRMGYAIYRVGDLRIIIRITDLRKTQSSGGNGFEPSNLNI